MTEFYDRYEMNALDAERSASLSSTVRERAAYLAIAGVWREFAAKARAEADWNLETAPA